MKSPTPEQWIRYWADDLSEKERQFVLQWIQQHPEEAQAYQRLPMELSETENRLNTYKTDIAPPVGYWNDWMPRLWNRIENQSTPAYRFRKWLPALVPALAAVVIMVYLIWPHKRGSAPYDEWTNTYTPEEFVETLLKEKKVTSEDLFSSSMIASSALDEVGGNFDPIVEDQTVIFDAEESLASLDLQYQRELIQELNATLIP